MKLIFSDTSTYQNPTPEGTVSLMYGTAVQLTFECVDEQSAPLDISALGMHQWKVFLLPTADSTRILGIWPCALHQSVFSMSLGLYAPALLSYLVGQDIFARPPYQPVPPCQGTYSPQLLEYNKGQDRAGIMQLRGYAIADSEDSLQYTISFPAMLLVNRDIRNPLDLQQTLILQLASACDKAQRMAAEAEKAKSEVIQDLSQTLTGVTIDGVLQPVQDRVAELESGSGDMRKAVYDQNNDGVVDDAEHAVNADYATNAGHADTADTAGSATYATSADSAASASTAGYATQAGEATNADYATNAGHASTADSATSATTAASATTATNADHATTADSATSAGAVPWSGVTDKPSFDYIPTSEKGAANGVATLDANGKVTSTELPPMDYAQSPVVLSVAGQAPTTSTEGEPGRRCVNTADGKAWTLTTKANTGTDQEPTWEYTWMDDINAKGGILTAPLYTSDGKVLISPKERWGGEGVTIGAVAKTLPMYIWGQDIFMSASAGTNRKIQFNRGQVSLEVNQSGVAYGYTNSGVMNPGITIKANGALQQKIITIPAATTAVTLTEGCHSHTPDEATTYTLPAVTDTTRTHQIRLCIDFTTVQTYAFVDSTDTAIVPLFTPTIAAGDVYEFRCEYSAMQSRWLIWPVKQGAVSDDYVMQAEVGAANGVAGLDANGKVPSGQLPQVTTNSEGAARDPGIIAVQWRQASGLEFYQNWLRLWVPSNSDFASYLENPNFRSGNGVLPIIGSRLNAAVTAALTDANHITLNATQQSTAQDVIGAAPASLHGSGAPTTSTAGKVGQGYVDDDTQKTYTCTKVTVDDTDPQNPVTTYTWTADVNAKGGVFGGDVTINGNANINGNLTVADYGQISGTYKTYNATTGAGTYANAFGMNASATGAHSNAFGYGATVSTWGDTAIGASSTVYLYVNGQQKGNFNGNLSISGGYRQTINTIPSATAAYTFAEGAFLHVPSATPTYTLPDITDSARTHEITLELNFAAYARDSASDSGSAYAWTYKSTTIYTDTTSPTAGTTTAYSDAALTTSAGTVALYDASLGISLCGSYSFEDAAGTAITPMSTPDIKPGTVVDFLCRWSPSLSKWCIMPIVMS